MKEHWRQLKQEEKKEKKNEGWALEQIQQFVEEKYNDYLRGFSQRVNCCMDSFWNEKSKLFKDSCQKVVHDSTALTKNQKDILESIVLSKDNMPVYRMNFNLRSKGIIHKKLFLGYWELKNEKFYVKRCCNELIRQFNDVIRARILLVVKTNEGNFYQWGDNLISAIEENLCDFNADLNVDYQKIEEIKSDIIYMQNHKDMLLRSKTQIDTLLSIQEGEENG